jgi:hypothetical protein
MKSLRLVAATAVAGALYVVSPAAKADIIFGNLTPIPACGALSGVGSVCGPNETFSFGGDTVIAHGFFAGPLTTTGVANLTLKPNTNPPNVFAESGLGVQNSNTPTTCTDPDCEIVPPQSVSATRVGSTLITDALIGSVQAGETFNFFVQTTDGGAWTQVGGNITNTCIGPGFSVAGTDLCRWDSPPGGRFGVAVQAVGTMGSPLGDILLTEVSTAAVPGPIVGAGLPGLVMACGALLVLVRRRRQQIV